MNGQQTKELTPMLQQYLEIKNRHLDSILFYRMGDFYEMFFEDAIKAAPLLEVQLTSRDKAKDNPIPMCGVPYHAATQYIEKLLGHGLKVAICEQIEDPKATKGIVKRDVVRIMTPSLIPDPELVPDDVTNTLIALRENPDNSIEVSSVDLLGAVSQTGVVSNPKLLFDLLYELNPKEILVSESVKTQKWFKELIAYFRSALVTTRNQYFDHSGSTTLNALEKYLAETQKSEFTHSIFEKTSPILGLNSMRLDAPTLASLEIIKGASGNIDAPCLFQTLDRTKTPMGRRLLKQWLVRPSADLAIIQERLDALDAFIQNPEKLSELIQILSQIRDLERLTTKSALHLSNPRDLVLVRTILKLLPDIKALLSLIKSERIKKLVTSLDPIPKLLKLLEGALLDEPPVSIRDGGIIRESYNPEVAELRSLAQNAKAGIAKMEAEERQLSGIGSLKIKYSKVFGYTIEVTTANLSKVPKYFIRKQTIANGERFVTEKLKAFEEKAESAEFRLKSLEESLFLDLRHAVEKETQKLLTNSRILAELDVLTCLAMVSKERGYVKPVVGTDLHLELVEARHPVIETLLPGGEFVPNSVDLHPETSRTLLITGPNMAGKSTIMRQTALATLLAHVGCYVPATSAKVPLTDAIFTRIGSSDDLARGKSTFMVEMTEVARILENATDRSLILIDEIGRGTSTYDGLSLAWSLLEFLHTEIKAKTLFATHFHELTVLEKNFSGLKNATVLVKKWNGEIIFLHKLAYGICGESYGVEVAALANIPSKVLLRAKEILSGLESQTDKGIRARRIAPTRGVEQLDFFSGSKGPESRASLDA